jgi:hypothetical protein
MELLLKCEYKRGMLNQLNAKLNAKLNAELIVLLI